MVVGHVLVGQIGRGAQSYACHSNTDNSICLPALRLEYEFSQEATRISERLNPKIFNCFISGIVS